MLEEYLLARRKEIQDQLNRRWINGIGRDISDLLRGKLEILDMFLNIKDVFESFDNLKKSVEEKEKGAK
jgi:hypothetical protein